MKRAMLVLGLAVVLAAAGCLNVSPNVSPTVKVNKDVKKRLDDLEQRVEALERAAAAHSTSP